MERGASQALRTWWEADYSWTGLARKSVSIDGSTMGLDEVFHHLASSLVDFDGRKWTPLHLPWCRPDDRPSDEPAGRNRLISEWLALPSGDVRGRCLSGVISPAGINLPRGVSGPLVADQMILGGGLALAGVDGLRVTRSRIDGNLRARRCDFAQDFTLFETEVTGAVDLADCAFARVVDIRACAAGGRIELSRARIQGYALMIEDTRADSGLCAEGAAVAGDVALSGTDLGSTAVFDRATIGGDLKASGTNFRHGLSLPQAVLAGDLDLHCATMDGPLILYAASIGGRLRARGSPGQPLAGLSARGARIDGQADFSGRAFTQSMDCSSVCFSSPPLMHGCRMHPDVSFAGATFPDLPTQARRAITAKLGGWRGRLARVLPLSWSATPEERLSYNLDCERLGNAFRTLRLAAAAVSNVEYEARFHVLELRMRRARTDVPAFERATSLAYDRLAACGTSLSRPVATIAATPVVGTLALFALFPAFTRITDAPTLFRFSLRQMAPPPTVWTAGDLAMSGPPITEIARQWPAPLLILGTLIFMTTATMLAVLLVALQRRFRQ